MFRYVVFTSIILLIRTYSVLAQEDTLSKSKVRMSAETALIFASGVQPPFWLRTNTYGSVPPHSTSGLAVVEGDFQSNKRANSPQLRLHIGVVSQLSKKSNFIIQTGEANFQYKGLDIYAGRRKEIIGIGDTLLSSGFYAWSGNALPLPKLHIGTKGFLPLQFTKDFVSLQGTLAHGWFGKGEAATDYYLHQKTMFVRLGKPFHRLKLYAGVAHYAQWGGYAPLLIGLNRTDPTGAMPKSFKDFMYVVIAKNKPQTPNISSYDSINTIGNHIATLDLAISYRFPNSEWLFYHQHPAETEVGISQNFPDGLYGISWSNTKSSKAQVRIKRILVEVLSTLDQSMRYDKKWGYLGDDYFNNSQYMDGWTYRRHLIGTPFVTLRTDSRPEWYDAMGGINEKNYRLINGNAVQMIYAGIQGTYRNNTHIVVKLAYSQNHIYYINGVGYQKYLSQFSGYVEVKQKVQSIKNCYIKFALGLDKGDWLPNNLGAHFSIQKTGFL